MEITYVKVNTASTIKWLSLLWTRNFTIPIHRASKARCVPIPKGAHIDQIHDGNRWKQAEAELLSADKARHIYEDIVRKLKDPALLEYAGRDIFKVRIFPIEPKQQKAHHNFLHATA